MTDTVLSDELLARYVIFSRWFRKQDQTVKPDAFIPPEDPLELSVTRHLSLSDDEIWNIGLGVATGQNRTLYGRADVKVAHVESHSLSVLAAPTFNNLNHANICGWPAQKDLRKMRALEIAQGAQFVANPIL